tara:strand:- start:165 stop:533 length:369 start_codon:yes stop_codon:yes gene_type:complete
MESSPFPCGSGELEGGDDPSLIYSLKARGITMIDNLRFMTSDWDHAIAGIVTHPNGKQSVVYDFCELVESLKDRGITLSVAKREIVAAFKDTSRFPEPPSLLIRRTPAETREFVFGREFSDV